MAQRFKGRKLNKDRIKYFITLIIIYIVGNIIFYIFFSYISISKDIILTTVLPNSKNNIINPKPFSLLANITSYLSHISISKPTTILNKSLIAVVDISDTNKDIITGIAFVDDYSNMNELEKSSGYIEDPNPKDITNPTIYIYNTHQLENYSMNNMEIYNIKPNVMMASYILRENLNKLGIPTIVDETNLAELLRVNSWTHKDSYKASRMPLVDAMEKYNTLKYYIDIHRDSPKREYTTLTIGDKTYARLMFVVGLENPKYESNLKLARTLNAMIDAKYPKLSRGVLTKEGTGVNGIYNQDLSPNSMLIEIGGIDNTIEEIANTTEIIAQMVYKYIKGD